MIFFGHILFFMFLTPFTLFAAPSAVVYAAGTYTDSSLDILLYADIIDCNLIGYGVKLGYNPTDLTVNTAVKNEDVWYLGEESSKQPYLNPDTTTAGEVVIIGGKLDVNNPMAGVTGDGILLGKISFSRNTSEIPVLSLTYGRSGIFKNFVTTEQVILDDQASGVIFDPIIPMVGGLSSTDTDKVVFFTCHNNENGTLLNKTCGGEWEYGGLGQIVGGNGNNIIVYRYDTAGDYTAHLTTAEAVSSIGVTAHIVETPLPLIDFATTVDTATVSLSVTDLDPNDSEVENVIVFWGDRYRDEYSLPATINHTYTRTGTSYHIRVKAVNIQGEEFNYTFISDEDLTVSIP